MLSVYSRLRNTSRCNIVFGYRYRYRGNGGCGNVVFVESVIRHMELPENKGIEKENHL